MNQAAAQPRVQPDPEAESATTKPVRTSDTGAASRVPIQTWTGKAIAEQIHGKPLGEGYRHWLFHGASRQPTLRDMYSKTFCAYGDTLLNLNLSDDYVVVSLSDSYICNVGQDLRGARRSKLKFTTDRSSKKTEVAGHESAGSDRETVRPEAHVLVISASRMEYASQHVRLW
ncbi:hypothetical protein [Bradyrhizobium sp. STM 3557]|uniref:hypothetical protein n=1 Tax=Bradyrhizobium sp. STM 3557 TaxID=578920 RepID=UPI00389019FB